MISILLAFSMAAAVMTGCGTGSASSGVSSASEAGASSAEKTVEMGENATTSNKNASKNAEKTGKMTNTSSSEAQTSEESTLTEMVNVLAMKGPTAMGMVRMMDDAAKKMADSTKQPAAGEQMSFTIASSVDEAAPAIVRGEADIAAVPANLAAVLYNQTKGAVQVLAVNTLGVLYIVDNGGTVKSISDLKGKTVYASGKGATPEYALRYILKGNGIDPDRDVSIEWKAEHAECLAALLADPEGIAMLPQPFVTVAQTKSDRIHVAVDLQKEWDAMQEGKDSVSSMITGVTVVRRAYAEEHPEIIQAFMERYKASAEFTNEHVEEAAGLIGAYEIVPEPVAKKAIPACHITFIAGQEMKEKLEGYLKVLMEQNPKAVGGVLPGEDFYYGAD